MRVTAELRDATRRRLLEKGAEILASRGWDRTTTRDIAAAAGLANGTLFNYFRTKEALGATLLAESFSAADEEFAARASSGSLEEDLFSFVWIGFRHLRPHRAYAKPISDLVLGPLADARTTAEGDAIRRAHLGRVQAMVERHSGTAAPAMTLQVYWSLYVGLLAFWVADSSPRQEDTLALLHHTIQLFVTSLAKTAAGGADVHQPR